MALAIHRGSAIQAACCSGHQGSRLGSSIERFAPLSNVRCEIGMSESGKVKLKQLVHVSFIMALHTCTFISYVVVLSSLVSGARVGRLRVVRLSRGTVRHGHHGPPPDHMDSS